MSKFLREYTNLGAAQRDIARLAAAGFHAQSVFEIAQKKGVMSPNSTPEPPDPHVGVIYDGEGEPPSEPHLWRRVWAGLRAFPLAGYVGTGIVFGVLILALIASGRAH